MESQKFDELSRAFASGATRREVLKGVLGGALGIIGFSRGVSAQAKKVQVCHLTDDPENPVALLSVSVNAVAAHDAHGDVIDPDFSSDAYNCNGCGVVCSAPENATATCVEGACGFACNEGYQLNATGDACGAISACPEGYEELNGNCFKIASGLAWGQCDNEPVCQAMGSLQGSGSYLCASKRIGTMCSRNSDCPSGSVCQTFAHACFEAC